MLKRLGKLCLSTIIVSSFVLTGCSNTSDTSSDGGANKQYVLKMSTQQNESDPLVDGFKELAKRVEEKTNGGLKIEVYPSAQLGNDEDVIEQAKQGVNVAVLTDGGRMANFVPEIGVIGAPYIVENYEDIVKLTESDLFKGWEERLASEHGIQVLSFNWYHGARHFLTNKPVYTPNDLKGVRIRTAGAPVWQESIKSLGATPVALPWTEVYSAVQQKALDGAEAQHLSTYTSRVHEVVKYVNKTEHFQLINGIIVGEKWFNTLPKEYQTILLEEAKTVAAETAQTVIDLADEYEEKMVESGVTIIESDIEAFKEASDSAYDALGYKELRNEVQEILEK